MTSLLESKGHPADTDQGEMFKDASGNLKSTLHGGNLKEASPDPKSSTNPVRVFKDANPGGQEVAILNDEVVTDQPSSDEALSPSPESRSELLLYIATSQLLWMMTNRTLWSFDGSG